MDGVKRILDHIVSLRTVQWLFIGVVSVMAVMNSSTDHGILMAVNCICIGFVLMSMLARIIIDRLISTLRRQSAEMQLQATIFGEACLAFQRAHESGEIVSIQPTDDDDHLTRH